MHLTKRPLAAERMVGLDVGDHSVSASLLGFGLEGTITLKAAGIVPLKGGDSNAVIAEAIRRLWRESDFASYTVCAGLRSTAVLFKHFSKPELTKDELKASLRLDAEEAMQTPSDRLAMDVHLLSSSAVATDGKDESLDGFYVAVPKSDVDRLLEILDMASLFPAIIDISCMAAANAFLRFHKPAAEKEEKSICLVCFEGHHADIIILQDDECKYVRALSAHGSNVHRTAAYMAEVLIEVIKHSHLAMGNDPVSKIYLSGVAEEPQEIEQLCRDGTGLPVEYWDPLEGMQLSHHLKNKWRDKTWMGMHLVRSLGLALRREG